jgi:hypothetical protein
MRYRVRMINELAIAEGIASGALPSPTEYLNSTYIKIRLSGTGVAYRPAVGEYVYRSPDIWLSPAMARRVLGLPIVIEHPPGDLLTSRYYGDRSVGTVVFSYVDEGEQALWGVGRVLDSNAASMIDDGLFCTSPAVLLPPGQSVYADVGGCKCLVEAAPTFIDHVALIYTGAGNKGVWQRQDGRGVQVDEPQRESELV